MGDPAGIGPEVIAGAWNSPDVLAVCRPTVIGHPEIMQRACRWVGAPIEVVAIQDLGKSQPARNRMPCLWPHGNQALQVAPGRADAQGGHAAYQALMTAIDQVQSGKADGLVTAPLSKEALHAAGYHVAGHTELLAQRCGVDRFAMALHLPPGTRPALGPLGLTVVHVTLHMALRQIWNHLSVQQVEEKIALAHEFCGSLSRAAGLDRSPRVAVAALNPHGGESGLFGDEEETIIRPAIERQAAVGRPSSGPLPADTLMGRAMAGQFDAVVAMYHDQGHIAVKLVAMHHAVNVTLGLPLVRTSVAHGTAFDLAGTGKADPQGMVSALMTCARLARARKAIAASS
jgi:4-hydroxythreonine-4-phosphate dehydrogenase